MKYCSKCGSSVPEGANFCPNCQNPLGTSISNYNQEVVTNNNNNTNNKTNAMCLAGFICSFFFILLGLIFSIVGLTQVKKNNDGGKGFAIAGIVICCLKIVMISVFFIFVNVIFNELQTDLVLETACSNVDKNGSYTGDDITCRDYVCEFKYEGEKYTKDCRGSVSSYEN